MDYLDISDEAIDTSLNLNAAATAVRRRCYRCHATAEACPSVDGAP